MAQPEQLELLSERLHDSTYCREVFDRVVVRYTEPLYWYARRMVVVHEDAEDVVQEGLIKAYDNLASFRGSGVELRAWLYRIITNTALSVLRRRRRGLFSSLDSVGRELAGLVAAECGEGAEEQLVRFQQAVLLLPVKQKLVFNLRYYDELSYAEIALVSGQSEQTLKVNYQLAVKRIKQLLMQ